MEIAYTEEQQALKATAAPLPIPPPSWSWNCRRRTGIGPTVRRVIVMSDTKAKELGITPLARIVASGVTGLNPEIMGLARWMPVARCSHGPT